MSQEFFSNITYMQRILDDIKFLEGSHPELYSKYNAQAKDLVSEIEKMHLDIKTDLEKKAKTIRLKTRKGKA